MTDEHLVVFQAAKLEDYNRKSVYNDANKIKILYPENTNFSFEKRTNLTVMKVDDERTRLIPNLALMPY